MPENSFIKKYGRLAAVCLFLGLLLMVFEVSGVKGHVTPDFLQHKIQENKFSGLMVFVLMFSLGNLIQMPGWIFLAAAVLAMGRVWGGIAVYIAAVASCLITFLVIRALGGDALRKLDSGLAGKILQRLDTHPIQSIVLLRTLFQTMPAVNYALAMSGVRFRQYLIGTLLGLPVPIVLYCLLFSYVAKAAGFAGA